MQSRVLRWVRISSNYLKYFRLFAQHKTGRGHEVLFLVSSFQFPVSRISYVISICDPNILTGPIELRVSADYSAATFNYARYDGTLTDGVRRFSKLTSAITMEDSVNNLDEKNLQNHLMSLDFGSGGTSALAETAQSPMMLQSSASEPYTLQTNYWHFTVELKNETDTAISEVRVIYSNFIGDLEIDFIGARNELGNETTLLYSLPALLDGQYYEITQLDGNVNLATMEPLSVYKTVMINDSGDGFRVSVTAEAAGKILIRDTGAVTTQYDEAVSQKITSTKNDVSTSWYTVSIEGTSESFTVAQKKNSVDIFSADETEITITVRNDTNEISFEDVPVNDEGIRVKEEAGETKIVDVDDEDITDPIEIGYSVIFYSLGGTAVEAITNIPAGSRIAAPQNPSRYGFVFNGWYKSAEYAELWNFDGDTVENDTILYAKWEPLPELYNVVTFRAEGHDDIIVMVVHGGSIAQNSVPAVPEKEGHYGYWDVDDFSNITSDMIVTAIYVRLQRHSG